MSSRLRLSGLLPAPRSPDFFPSRSTLRAISYRSFIVVKLVTTRIRIGCGDDSLGITRCDLRSAIGIDDAGSSTSSPAGLTGI